MDGEGDKHLSHESSKRGRKDSPAASAESSKRREPEGSIVSKRSKLASSFVRNKDDRLSYLSQSGMVDKLINKLFKPVRSANDPQHLTPFVGPSKVNHQMQKFRNMVPIGSNILLTEVKIFYFALEKDQSIKPFKKMYRYVFFKFEDAIFALKLTGIHNLSCKEAMHIFFIDNEGQICTLANLLQSNYTVEDASFRLGRDGFDQVKQCRFDKSNKMLRESIRDTSKPQEYENLLQALQGANDSTTLQMVVPKLESLIMLLLKIGIGIDKDAIKQIFRNNPNIHFPNMTLPEINAAIDKGIQLSQMLQREVSGRRGGSRRYSTKRRSLRKSRTVKKRK